MKIRSGFVSNSSSSSFIILGFSTADMDLSRREILDKIAGKEKVDEEISKRVEEWKFTEEEALDDAFYDLTYIIQNCKELPITFLEDREVIGLKIAEGHDDGELLQNGSLSLMDMIVKAEQIRDLLNIDNDIEWKIFYGNDGG